MYPRLRKNISEKVVVRRAGKQNTSEREGTREEGRKARDDLKSAFLISPDKD